MADSPLVAVGPRQFYSRVRSPGRGAAEEDVGIIFYLPTLVRGYLCVCVCVCLCVFVPSFLPEDFARRARGASSLAAVGDRPR